MRLTLLSLPLLALVSSQAVWNTGDGTKWSDNKRITLREAASSLNVDIGTCVLPKYMFPELYDQGGRRESTKLRASNDDDGSAAVVGRGNDYNDALKEHFTSVTIEHHLKVIMRAAAICYPLF